MIDFKPLCYGAFDPPTSVHHIVPTQSHILLKSVLFQSISNYSSNQIIVLDILTQNCHNTTISNLDVMLFFTVSHSKVHSFRFCRVGQTKWLMILDYVKAFFTIL